MLDGLYQVEQLVANCVPKLSESQRRNLSLWVYGALLAKSACETAVLMALSELGRFDSLRQRLRATLDDGVDKRRPCQAQIDVSECHLDILTHILARWSGGTLPLAIDATMHEPDLAVVAISVLYRGTAIPFAWHVVRAHKPGPWIGPLCQLMDAFAPAVDKQMQVLVLTDRGLWSPRLYRAILSHGWHPLMRIRPDAVFRRKGARKRVKAASLTGKPGYAWTGEGVAFKHSPQQIPCTLVVYWGKRHQQPWLLLTDLPANAVGVQWYAMRYWIEFSFRQLKSAGLHFERTRRKDTRRVARHWLVLALAMLSLALCGTYEQDTHADRLPPAYRKLRVDTSGHQRRRYAVITLALAALPTYLLRGMTQWYGSLIPHPCPEIPEEMDCLTIDSS